jgi:hypothetical protein
VTPAVPTPCGRKRHLPKTRTTANQAYKPSHEAQKLAVAGHAVIAQATRGIPAARLAAFDQTLADMASNLSATRPA